jgi:hypothetical protein
MLRRVSARIARTATRAAIKLIIANAGIAILAILGSGGEFEMRVIGTTSLITAATITVAVNAASCQRWRSPAIPAVGIVLSTLAFGVLIAMIWAEPDLSDGFLELLFATLTVGIGASYASLMQIPNLASQFERARLASFLGDGALVVMTVVGIVGNEFSGRLYAIVCVIVAAAAVIVFIGTRAGRSDEDATAARFCPACADPIERPDQCGACGAAFRIDFISGPTCGDEPGQLQSE